MGKFFKQLDPLRDLEGANEQNGEKIFRIGLIRSLIRGGILGALGGVIINYATGEKIDDGAYLGAFVGISIDLVQFVMHALINVNRRAEK